MGRVMQVVEAKVLRRMPGELQAVGFMLTESIPRTWHAVRMAVGESSQARRRPISDIGSPAFS